MPSKIDELFVFSHLSFFKGLIALSFLLYIYIYIYIPGIYIASRCIFLLYIGFFVRTFANNNLYCTCDYSAATTTSDHTTFQNQCIRKKKN